MFPPLPGGNSLPRLENTWTLCFSSGLQCFSLPSFSCFVVAMRTWDAGSLLLPVQTHHIGSGHHLSIPEYTPWSSVHQCTKTSKPVGSQLTVVGLSLQSHCILEFTSQFRATTSSLGRAAASHIASSHMMATSSMWTLLQSLPSMQDETDFPAQYNAFYPGVLLQPPVKRSFASMAVTQRRMNLWGDKKVRWTRLLWWTHFTNTVFRHKLKSQWVCVTLALSSGFSLWLYVAKRTFSTFLFFSHLVESVLIVHSCLPCL